MEKVSKLIVVMLLVGTIVMMASYSIAAKEEQLNYDTVSQQLTVVEPLAVSFSYPWKGAELGEPLIFRDVGKIKVHSNVEWALGIESIIADSGINISVRPVNDFRAKWQPLNKFKLIYSGGEGLYNISWDVKIELSPNSRVANNFDLSSGNEMENYLIDHSAQPGVVKVNFKLIQL